MTDPHTQSNDAPTETIVEHIIRSIRDGIREGHFAQGQRLVVAEISRDFGASAGPVREAIRRLTGEGLLDFTPHRGATVRKVSERDVREIFQVREALEGYAARMAAENIDRADFRSRMQACLERIRLTIGDRVANSNAHQDFHDLLYEICGNATLEETATRLTSPLYRLHYNRIMGLPRAQESLREHDGIIEAILAGDGVRAERLMRVHLRNGALAVCEVIADLDQSQPVKSQEGR